MYRSCTPATFSTSTDWLLQRQFNFSLLNYCCYLESSTIYSGFVNRLTFNHSSCCTQCKIKLIKTKKEIIFASPRRCLLELHCRQKASGKWHVWFECSYLLAHPQWQLRKLTKIQLKQWVFEYEWFNCYVMTLLGFKWWDASLVVKTENVANSFKRWQFVVMLVPTYFSMLNKPACQHWKSELMRTKGCSHDLWLWLLNSKATQSQKAVARLQQPRTITFSSGPHIGCNDSSSLTQPQKTNKQYRVGNNIPLNSNLLSSLFQTKLLGREYSFQYIKKHFWVTTKYESTMLVSLLFKKDTEGKACFAIDVISF